MNFYTKSIAAFGGIIVLAMAAIFLMRSSDEDKILALLEGGAEAASKKDPEAVVALVSRSYLNGEEDYDAVCARIRKEIQTADRPPLRVLGAAIDVLEDEAESRVTLQPQLGPYKGSKLRLHLKWKRESGEWKVTWAKWIR